MITIAAGQNMIDCQRCLHGDGTVDASVTMAMFPFNSSVAQGSCQYGINGHDWLVDGEIAVYFPWVRLGQGSKPVHGPDGWG